jgi:hypothetical protein
VKSSGPDLHVVRLGHHAALAGPESVQLENNVLKIHRLSLVIKVLGSGFKDSAFKKDLNPLTLNGERKTFEPLGFKVQPSRRPEKRPV